MSASHPLLQKIEVAETVSGEFYWDVRATTPLASSSATGPQSKFDLLVWLGLMPDTQILSNKLIKLVGEHIFETLWRKANYTSIFSALERRRQAASSLFDPVEQEELWQCWRLVAKLRALQEIDYLFNQATLSESDISTRFAQTRTAVAELYPQPQEQEEKKWLDLELLKLENGLKLAKTTKDRNALLQQAQQNLFRGLFAYFQMKQGKLSAKQHHILARENWENTNITREAENILQNWEFGETGLIKDSMLFRNDGGDIFYSGTYPEANKRRLLFAAHLGEVLGPRLGLDANTNTNPDVFNEKNNNEKYRLHEVMANFQQLKKEISKKTIALKKESKKQNPASVELETKSSLFRDWWQLWKTSTKRETELIAALQAIKTEMIPVEASAAPSDPAPLAGATTPPPPRPAVPASLANGVSTGIFTLTTPAEKNYLYSPGDTISSTLRFLYDFSLYFDQLIDKHPFVGTTAFTLPYLQFGGIGLSLNGGSQAFVGLADFFAVLESKLLAGKVTAAQITEAVKIVDEAVLWFTSAESSLQVLITCGFTISKVSFTVVDTLVNDFLSNIDETTITDLAKKLDPTESLAGETRVETLKRYVGNILSGTLLLIIAGGIGVAGDLSNSALIEFFAHVPRSLILEPSIQTLGAIKSSGLLIGKIAGINNYMSKEQLIDIHGTRITAKSVSYQVLKLFVELSLGIKKLAADEKKSVFFKKARYHFEQLLELNPQLVSFYDKKKLKDLGVKQRYSTRFHRLPLALFKSLFYSLLFVPAILAHLYYAYTQKPVPPLLRLCVAIPINWLVLLGKIFWTCCKAAVHGFLQVAIRAPEVAIQSLFVAARFIFGKIGKTLAIAAGYTLKALGYIVGKTLCPDPAKTTVAHFFDDTIGNTLKVAQIIAVSWVRIQIRYRLEQLLGALLKIARDYLVRRAEQWLQRALAPEPSTPTIEPTSNTDQQKSATALVQQILASYQKEKKTTSASIPAAPTSNPTTASTFSVFDTSPTNNPEEPLAASLVAQL